MTYNLAELYISELALRVTMKSALRQIRQFVQEESLNNA